MDAPVFELKTVAMLPGGHFSAFLYRGTPFAVALDPGVLRNGTYRCKRDYYHAGGYPTFEIIVEGHTLVKFHRGNRKKDSTACVLVAESFGVLMGDVAVLDSAHGFDEFMQLAEGLDTFDLVVSGR